MKKIACLLLSLTAALSVSFSVGPAAFAAGAVTVRTDLNKAAYLAEFQPTELCQQAFGSVALPPDNNEIVPLHSSPISQNSITFQLSAPNGLFADPNDVTTAYCTDDLTISISGSAPVYSAALGLICTDASGVYRPGKTVGLRVNGQPTTAYTTETNFADNCVVVSSSEPITSIVLAGTDANSNQFNGLSWLALSAGKNANCITQADNGGPGQTPVQMSVQPAYTVTIPENVLVTYRNINPVELTVAASGLLLEPQYKLQVAVSGSGTGGAFVIGNGTNSLPYEVSSQSSPWSPLAAGDTLTAFTADATAKAFLKIPQSSWDSITTAGSYSGSLLFTISYQQA